MENQKESKCQTREWLNKLRSIYSMELLLSPCKRYLYEKNSGREYTHKNDNNRCIRVVALLYVTQFAVVFTSHWFCNIYIFKKEKQK